MTKSSYELISHHLCPYVQRAVITLTEKGIDHRRTYIDLADKPAWFREISPLGRVPLLRTADAVLFESAVICEYLDEATPDALHPADPLEKARHRAWIEFGSSILDTIAGFYNAPDATTFDQKRGILADRFAWLDRHVAATPYFAGKDFHLVDAVYGPIFRYFNTFDDIGDFGVMTGLAGVGSWRAALAARPSIRGAVATDYPDRLRAFLLRRNSYLSSLMERENRQGRQRPTVAAC